MKKTIRKSEITAFLSLALFSLALNFSVMALAQTPQRQRAIEKPTPTPKNTPRVSPSATPTVQPTVTPIPAATPSATPTPAPVQTLPELQNKIRSILLRPAIMRGQVGLKVISLDSNKVLFEDNAEKYFMPASNMKSFTIAAAMEKLTPNFRFVTSVYATSQPDASGTIRGDLTIYGRGDPSFSMAFTRPDTTSPVTESDYLKGLDALAEKIVQSGVKRVEGNLIGDESYFNTDAIPSTWEWDDLQWYYGAEVSALTILDNALDLSVKPASVGAPAIIQLMPSNSLMTIINRTVTAPAGTKRELEVTKRLAQNVLEVSGKIPADDKGYTSSVAVSRPAMLFTTLLRKVLEQKGIVITGQTRVVDAKEKALNPVTIMVQPVEIAKLESPPFALIAAKTMKPSQNLYTELILRALGEQVGDKTDPKKSSERRGIEVVSSFLTQAGITPGSVLQYDGCGLSRHDLITPAASAQLYTYMNARPYAASWRESLTIAGVDGTLKNRFINTPAAANVRGKTGTIAQVSALSGYVTTAAGERLAFSVLTNGIPETGLRTSTIDEIVLLLTNFNGKTN